MKTRPKKTTASKFFLLGIIPLLLLFPAGASAKSWSGGANSDEGGVPAEEVNSWREFDGSTVKKIEIHGLVRTKEQAILWLMATKLDGQFSAERLKKDLQTLYNTGNLYDLKGTVTALEGGVSVEVFLKDKWTLFPVVGAQGGGGSSTLGAGVFESNLLGYMANASFLYWTFNNTASFDLNFNQEYFAGTQTTWSLDWQDNIEAQTTHFVNGTQAGQFAWRRQQKEIMVGTHVDGPWRVMMYASVYQDSVMSNPQGFYINLAPNILQQRFYPKFIYGRVDWSNYLEHGFELTVQPTVANLIGSGPYWSALEVDFKRVWVVGSEQRDNIAMYLSGSAMQQGGPNYIYQVGGYYNIRGFPDMRELGNKIVFANLEYRPFLAKTRFNFLDLDLLVLQGCVFTDMGSAWGDSSLTGESDAQNFHPLWSVGAGIRINAVKFAGAILRLDWAQTISPNEGIGFSFGVGQFF